MSTDTSTGAPSGPPEGSRVATEDPTTDRAGTNGAGTDGRPGTATSVDPTEAAPGPAPTPGGGISTWVVPLLVLVAGMFMSVLDISIVNVAIPVMQNDFGVNVDDIQWVSTSYSLAEGVIVPASAWLGLRFGLARCYTWSLVLFTLSSALCGLAWDLNSMIAFRILQAIPGGVIPVVALTALYRVVPRDRLGVAMGMYGLGIVVAPAVGPTLGGYLVEYVDWPLIFFINVPIGVIGTLAAVFYLPSFGRDKAPRFDLPGFLAIASGLFALLIALHEGEKWGWTSYPVIILLVYGVLAIALFVVIERETRHPLLDVRVFASWAYSNSLIIIAIVMMGMFGVLFFIPQSLQINQGLGAFETGLVLMPQALVMAMIMPLAGQIYDRIGPRWPAVIGLVIVTYGTWLLRDVTVDTSHAELTWVLALRAGGVALAMMPMMTGGMSSLSADLVDNGSAFNTVVQRTSQAIGLAGLTAVMTGMQSQAMADRTGLMDPATLQSASVLETYSMSQQVQTTVFDTAFGDLMYVTTGLSAVAVVLAFFLPSGKPAGSGGGMGGMH